MKDAAANPALTFPVYQSVDMSVVCGANLGDPISFAAELNLGDIYEMQPHCRAHHLSLTENENGSFAISYDTNLGQIGTTVHLDSCLTLMSPTGIPFEVLILVEVDHRGDAEAVYILPLAPLKPGVEYTLIDITHSALPAKFASVAITHDFFMDFATI
jgi:hypothetical protein